MECQIFRCDNELGENHGVVEMTDGTEMKICSECYAEYYGGKAS